MKRRSLMFAAGASAVLTAARAQAQSSPAPRRIGWLSTGAQDNFWTRANFATLSARLKELGYVEGRDVVFERRWGGTPEDLATAARELVALKPALIFAISSPVTAALQKETLSVPIVFTNIGEPVEQGFVASLARPGGNITGTTFRFELMNKLVELIRDTLPAASRLALLEDERVLVSKRVTMHSSQAASALGYKLNVVRAKGPEDMERAFSELVRSKTQVLILPPQYVGIAKQVADLAMGAKLPTFSSFREFAVAGALLSNYSDSAEGSRRAAGIADKILKGATPAVLPVEEPERLYLAINLRTAKALGIKIPQAVLVRADEVIE